MFLYPIIKFLILRGTQGATLSAILGITLGIMLSDTSNYENVPEGWVLTDIGELLTNRDSERVPLSLGVRSKQENKIYDYYGATGVVDKVDGYLFDERLLLIGEDGANLLSRSKDNAFFAEGKYWVNNHAHILDCPEKEVLDYVAFLINSMSLEDYITGSAQPKLNQDNLNKIEIPLPPLEEQRRIIAQVNLWQRCLMELETSENELNESVESAKSKILDLAIHGKLVPQDANDEPASELLKRINPKAVASCDNPHYEQEPFEIPDNWAWVRIDEINKFKSKSVNPQNYPTDQFELYSVPTFEMGEPEFPVGKDVASSKVEVEEGDVLLCKINPHLNRVWVVRRRMAQLKPLASSEWIVIRADEIIPEYLILTMQAPYFRELMMSNVSGVGGSLMRAQPSFVKQYMIPIPPIREQKHIIEKVSQFNQYIEAIASTLL